MTDTVSGPDTSDADPADPGFGQRYGCGPEPAYVTPAGVAVWMQRHGQRVRFYTAAGQQVGPEHRNVAPATVWAGINGWVDPTAPLLSLGVIAETRANARYFDERYPEAGAWLPNGAQR